MNILAIGAHFDDVELGCGGALARHAQQGDNVYVFVATASGFANQYNQEVRSSESALAEARNAMEILGVTETAVRKFQDARSRVRGCAEHRDSQDRTGKEN